MLAALKHLFEKAEEAAVTSGRFTATENGCGHVHGTAYLQGNTLIAETVGGSGASEFFNRYAWQLPPHTCGKASGTVTCVKGAGVGNKHAGTLEPM